MGRESDFGLAVPAGLDDQTTFLMSEPGLEMDQTSPLAEQSITEAVASAQAQERTGDVVLGDDDVDMSQEDDVLDDQLDVTEAAATVPASKRGLKTKKQKRLSRLGIEYPPLPPSFVKRVAQTSLQTSGLSNSRISPDTLAALTQASEWFFEQLGDDLGAYASHAKRKTIEQGDVHTLMLRYVTDGYHHPAFYSANIVQATPGRCKHHDVLASAETLAKGTFTRVEDADPPAREAAPC